MRLRGRCPLDQYCAEIGRDPFHAAAVAPDDSSKRALPQPPPPTRRGECAKHPFVTRTAT